MTNREFCLSRRQAESPAFVRVLKALPADQLDYRPHPKCRSAGQIAWLLAQEEAALVSLIDQGKAQWAETEPPGSVEEIVQAFAGSHAAVNERLSRLADGEWDQTVQFLIDGMPPWETRLSEFVWLTLFDAVHHRGQLSAYLRPMGGKVPSIYGPSADDPGGA
jgi:uncharacterized damage-inducible protein DinB